MSAPACISPFDVVDAQFEAYNAQDLEAFCSFYAEDAVLADFTARSPARAWTPSAPATPTLWARFPQNKAELKGRHVLGQRVIDHEHVVRSPGGDTFDVAAIYTISDAKIVRASTS